MRFSIALIITASSVSTALAGGYRLSLQGPKALGMGHTGTAVTESAEVVFFNPAGMVFLPSRMDFTAGVTPIQSDSAFQNQATRPSAETDNDLGTPVNVYFVTKRNEQISYGLGIYAPYENAVDWEGSWAGSPFIKPYRTTSHIYITHIRL